MGSLSLSRPNNNNNKKERNKQRKKETRYYIVTNEYLRKPLPERIAPPFRSFRAESRRHLFLLRSNFLIVVGVVEKSLSLV